MKQGDIVCWQFWDNQLRYCLSSTKHDRSMILNYFPTLTPLTFWRIKKLKQ